MQSVQIVVIIVLPDAEHEGSGLDCLVGVTEQFVQYNGLDMRQVCNYVADFDFLRAEVKGAVVDGYGGALGFTLPVSFQ